MRPRFDVEVLHKVVRSCKVIADQGRQTLRHPFFRTLVRPVLLSAMALLILVSMQDRRIHGSGSRVEIA